MSMFKKNLGASKPYEHPPSGEKMSKGLGGNMGGLKRQNLFVVSYGFPNVTTSGQQYNIKEKPSVISYCTLTLISMQGQGQQKQVLELY